MRTWAKSASFSSRASEGKYQAKAQICLKAREDWDEARLMRAACQQNEGHFFFSTGRANSFDTPGTRVELEMAKLKSENIRGFQGNRCPLLGAFFSGSYC